VAGVAYLDTNVFIDAIEGTDSISLPIKALLEAGRGRRGALVTSELTLAEVLASGRQERMSADLKRLYLDLIVWGGFIDLRPVSREVIYETAELRPYAPMKLPDAIHLATAVLTSCRFFLTRDQGFRRMPGSMIKIEPSADGIAQIVSQLND
jgi:predicted nucleic acid-binding protein